MMNPTFDTEKFESELMERISSIRPYGTVFTYANLWECNDKRRVYVNQCWRVNQGREKRSYGFGYVDLKTRQFIAQPKGYPVAARTREDTIEQIEEIIADLLKECSNTTDDEPELVTDTANGHSLFSKLFRKD